MYEIYKKVSCNINYRRASSFPCKSSVLQGPAIDYDFIKYWFYKDINTLECSFIKALIHPLVRTIFV